jgi:hypothetical protein
VILDIIVAIHAAIHGGDCLEGADDGLDEEAHEAELHAVLLGEGFLHFAAQLHDGRHVGFIEGGEDRSGVLRHDELLRDLPPERAEALARGAAFARGGGDVFGNDGECFVGGCDGGAGSGDGGGAGFGDDVGFRSR